MENLKRSVAYAGAFLLKEDPEIDSSSGSESGKSVYDLKGKELFKRLHEVGTLAQVLLGIHLTKDCCRSLILFSIAIMCGTCLCR